MIDQLGQFLAPICDFIEQHVPRDQLPSGDLVLGILLVAGVLVSTLGALLARPIVVLGLIAVGGLGAAACGHVIDAPLPLVIIGGAVAGGLAGYVLFRLWVGLAAGVLCAMIAIAVYGSFHIVPHLATFHPPEPAATVADFVVPDVPATERDPWLVIRDKATEFWAHLKTQQADVETYTLLAAAAAGLFGLLIGLLASRFTLVLSTALVGTVLVWSALAMALRSYWPDRWALLPTHAATVNVAVLAFFGASLLLQTVLTRRRPQAEPAAE